jgi:Putative transposase
MPTSPRSARGGTGASAGFWRAAAGWRRTTPGPPGATRSRRKSRCSPARWRPRSRGGPRAGQPGRRLRSAADATATGPRGARLEGVSLHADLAGPARRRDRLEHLVRYLMRPPLALARLTASTGGPLLYQFRRAWSDGSTALLVDPLELLERLAALVPPPRRPLLASQGVRAPPCPMARGDRPTAGP